MHSHLNVLLAVIFSHLLGASLYAQTFSPHSQFGIGNLYNPIFSSNKAMGGIAAGYAGSREINSLNPASYAAMRYTNFNIGLRLHSNIISTDSIEAASVTNGGINHLAIAFPVMMNHWGMTIGLLPYSYKNYSYASQLREEGLHYDYYNKGTGSTYKLFWGNGFEYKNFRFGVNAGFLFGKLKESNEIVFTDTTGYINTTSSNEINLKDFTADFGLQYTFELSRLENQERDKPSIFMTVGTYGAPTLTLKSTRSKYSSTTSTNPFSEEQTPIDSATGGLYDDKAHTKLPAYFGAGFTIGNELTWTTGLDFHFENWKIHHNPLNNIPLENAWKIKLGGEIKPDYTSKRFGNQINYRLGAHLGKSYVSHDGKSVPEFGMTFGFGLPLGKVTSTGLSNKLNLTMEIGRRGVVSNQAFKENYYKITLAYALSDRWFIKRKFD